MKTSEPANLPSANRMTSSAAPVRGADASPVEPLRDKPLPSGAGSARDVVQRESHIEFDERLVQGQTAAGAIYLFQRGESEFRSMVKLPESFRDRTVQPLLPHLPTTPGASTATVSPTAVPASATSKP